MSTLRWPHPGESTRRWWEGFRWNSMGTVPFSYQDMGSISSSLKIVLVWCWRISLLWIICYSDILDAATPSFGWLHSQPSLLPYNDMTSTENFWISKIAPKLQLSHSMPTHSFQSKHRSNLCGCHTVVMGELIRRSMVAVNNHRIIQHRMVLYSNYGY